MSTSSTRCGGSRAPTRASRSAAITEVAAGQPDCPALLFDAIKGFPRGFRIFTNATVNPQRAALALGIDPALRPLDALKAWMEKRKTLQPQQPAVVKDAAFLQNTMQGAEVDLARFPAPVWHRHDGGPFIGSGSIVIMRDPDRATGGGWINASIYRVQVHGRSKVTVQFDHAGRHGAIIARKYWEAGKPCPLAVVNGEDPALFIAGFEYLAGRAIGIRVRRRHQRRADRGPSRTADRSADPGAGRDRVRRPSSADERDERCRKGRSASSPAITPRRRGRRR